MFPVRMSHPAHGFAHAYDETEQARMEKDGWAVEQPIIQHIEEPKKRGRPKAKA